MALGSYNVLEPKMTGQISQISPGASLGFNASSPTDLFQTTSFLYVAAIMAIVLVAAQRYMLAGIWRIQASEASITKSNKEISRVTWGLVLVLSLFVILYTFNKGLLKGDVGLEGLRANTKAGGGVAAVVPRTTTMPTNSNYQARKASHEAVVARLAPSNIHTNYNDVPCTEAQFGEAQPRCTSLAYLPEETIQLLLKLNGSCHCTIVITGGTEPGHQTHGENKRPVDLRLGGPRGDPNNTDPLYVYVKNTATNKFGSSGTCYEKYILFGFQFCDEKPPNTQHFHVS